MTMYPSEPIPVHPCRIVFINPPDDFLEKAGDRPPIGLAQLSSYVKKKHGFKTKIIDLNHENLTFLIHMLQDFDPDYICFTSSFPTHDFVVKTAKYLRKNGFDDQRYVLGGTFTTAVGHNMDKKTREVFDCFIIGDGESGLDAIFEMQNPAQLIYAQDLKNLDDLPYPDYEGIYLDRYFMRVAGDRGVLLVGSRGCKYACAYCGSSNIKKVRQYSARYMYDHMYYLYKNYDIKNFYFGDDVFTYDRNKILEFCKLIHAKDHGWSWRCTTRADLLDEELLINMKNAGCEIISLGLESGNDMVLRRIHKGLTTEKNKEAIIWCHDIGIKVKGFFILGLPGDTPETIQETIRFAKSLKLEYCDFYPLSPYPNTALWDKSHLYGIQVEKPKNIDDWKDYYQVGKDGAMRPHVTYVNGLSPDYIVEMCNKAYKELGKGGLTYD